MPIERVGVADAKRRFAELADRVGRGESFLVLNRGQPVLALVPPQRVAGDADEQPLGLAAFAAALDGEWDTIDDDMAAVIAARSEVTDRQAPELR
jgi:prevent-host-death family protein